MGWSRRVTIKCMKTTLKIGLIGLFLAACQGGALTPTETPTTTVIPTQTESPLMQARRNEIASIWENSIHAQTAQPVQCEDCHLLKNGLVLETVSRRNQQTGQHEAVSDLDVLCSQCHEGVSAEHAHIGFLCVDCHDPHKVGAACTDSGCHSNIPTVFYEIPATPVGGHPANGSSFCGGNNCHSVATAVAQSAGFIHGPAHASVTCEACHDASQLQVGPFADNGNWVTMQEDGFNGEVVRTPTFSHDIQLEVDCARCHFEDSSWGLPLVTGQEFEK